MPKTQTEYRNCQVCGNKFIKTQTGTANYANKPFWSVLSCEPCYKKRAAELGVAREWERFEADEEGYENVKRI